MRTISFIGSALATAVIAGGLLLCTQGRSAAEDKVPEYVGAAACKKCHLKQFKSWGETPHAKAFETLKPNAKADKKKAAGLDPTKDYTKEEKCVRCHVTGHGKPAAKGAVLENVQCETCHGPGSLAIPIKKANEKFKMAEILPLGHVKPDTKLCAGCHNEESPTVPKGHVFDFEKMMKEGVHERVPLKHEH